MPKRHLKMTHHYKTAVLFSFGLCIIIYCIFVLAKNPVKRFSTKRKIGGSGLSLPDYFDIHEKLKKRRIVIVGAGVTGLGAAYRLHELGILQTNTQVVVLDKERKAGGLASSTRDDSGFLWDNGGHVVFSHYKYFDRVLDTAVSEWNKHKRAAFAFMKGSSGKRRFIPYPVQDNVMSMDYVEQQRILRDIQHLAAGSVKRKPRNFDEWLLQNFGKELCTVFMRKYNRKVWTVDPKQMNAVWVGERVAIPSIKKIKANAAHSSDSQWGPNRLFRFPRYDGTGGIWTSVQGLLPQGWFHFNHEVTDIDITKKKLKVMVGKHSPSNYYYLHYDILINTVPLDKLLSMTKINHIHAENLAKELLYSRTHIVGLGLKGKAPQHLADKSWMYFPDSDSPFYRVTVFSKYSADHVPQNGTYWSLMCEAAEPLKYTGSPSDWTQENLLEKTISALIIYNFITKDQVISKYYHKLHHGYPIPFLKREKVLGIVQPLLESASIYSRGRFGGWRYEVGNQDHSFMQGVEVIDRVIRGIPEETYPNANLVNSMRGSDRTLSKALVPPRPDYEVVVAHYDENLDWLLSEASHTHVYHKGNKMIPDLRFQQWQRLPNVGRESHTYLYHIMHNYDRLADVTVFIQGGSNDQSDSPFCFTNINKYIKNARAESFAVKLLRPGYKNWGRITHHGKWLKWLKSGKMRRSRYTMGEMWELSLGSPHPPAIKYSVKGCFAVTRERIHFRSLDVYKKLVGFVDDHSNPEEGHYFERMWHGIFFGN